MACRVVSSCVAIVAIFSAVMTGISSSARADEIASGPIRLADFSGDIHNQIKPPANATAVPVTPDNLYSQMRIQAGQYAARNPHQILVGDFTCDGVVDRIAGWVDRDNPDGPFFDLLFVTGEGGKIQSEMKFLPFAQSKHFALCVDDKTAPPPMSWQKVDQDYVADVVGDKSLCPMAVRVEDFMCDAPQFFWRKDADKDGNHWVFYRN